MKIGSARNLVMFNFTGLSFLVHIARASSAGRVGAWVYDLSPNPTCSSPCIPGPSFPLRAALSRP
jgi:hypothetical protein